MVWLTKDILDPGLQEWSILQGYRGSFAHGLWEAGSDTDLLSICVPPLAHYVGIEVYGNRGNAHIQRPPWDVTVWELGRFIHHCLQGHPSELEALWLPRDMYTHMTGIGVQLLDQRYMFSSRAVYGPIKSYATAYLKVLSETTWLQEAVPWKLMMETVRLLRMGLEYLRTGTLRVVREADREELLAIKHGEWSVERTQFEIRHLLHELEVAYLDSPLPAAPRTEEAQELCLNLIDMAWEMRDPLEAERA